MGQAPVPCRAGPISLFPNRARSIQSFGPHIFNYGHICTALAVLLHLSKDGTMSHGLAPLKKFEKKPLLYVKVDRIDHFNENKRLIIQYVRIFMANLPYVSIAPISEP